MSLLSITVSHPDDFVTFMIEIDLNDVQVGDKLRFKNIVLSVHSKVHNILETADFLPGSTYYECAPLKVSEYKEFYQIIDFFKMRFEFVGSFITYRKEPLLAYKLYRLYRFVRKEDELITDDTCIGLVDISIVLKYLNILGIDCSEDDDFSEFISDGRFDLLAFLLDFSDEDLKGVYVELLSDPDRIAALL